MSSTTTTTIPHPRRLLTLSAPHTPLLPFLHHLTRSSPPSPDPSTGSLAGLTHEWLLRTPYYTAQIPIWIDEIADPAAWKQDFLRPEAREVVEVVGGWVYGFAVAAGAGGGKEEEMMMKEEVGRTMKAVREVVESHLGFEGAQEVVLLAVALPASPSLLPSLAEAGETTALTTMTQQEMGSRSGSGSGSGGARTQGLFTPSATADWEDLALEHGFEFIDATRTGRNEFGERTGLERVREALEANDWAGGGGGGGASRPAGGAGEAGEVDGDDLDGFLEEFDPDVDGVLGAREEAEMTAELFGLKAALMREEVEEEEKGARAGVEDKVEEAERRAPAGGRVGALEEVGEGEGEGKTQAGQVEDLERMMATLLAVREQSAGLPEAERRRVAARAVRGVMGGGGG